MFFERDNYLYFLRGIKKYLRGMVDVLAYCLLPTHYHILVRVKALPQASEVLVSRQVSLAMQKFLISYTKAIKLFYITKLLCKYPFHWYIMSVRKRQTYSIKGVYDDSNSWDESGSCDYLGGR